MGNRRMGLGRLEALLEAVDRDLNLVNTTLTNCTITTSAYATFTGGVQVTHAVLTPAASVSINKADHAGRILTIASTATANDSYILPTAASVGESYRFVWSGVAADADNVFSPQVRLTDLHSPAAFWTLILMKQVWQVTSLFIRAEMMIS